MRDAKTRQVTCVEHKRFHPQTRNANIQRWADTYLCRSRRECDILLAALKEKMERMISTDVLIIGAGPGGLATAIVPLFTTVRGRRVFRDASGGSDGQGLVYS